MRHVTEIQQRQRREMGGVKIAAFKLWSRKASLKGWDASRTWHRWGRGPGAGRGHEGVTLRQRGLGVNKEPRHWSRVSVTKGRGKKCENTGVTTVSQNRHSPYSEGIDISCGWEERINDCTNELNNYTNKWNKIKGHKEEVHGTVKPHNVGVRYSGGVGGFPEDMKWRTTSIVNRPFTWGHP